MSATPQMGHIMGYVMSCIERVIEELPGEAPETWRRAASLGLKIFLLPGEDFSQERGEFMEQVRVEFTGDAYEDLEETAVHMSYMLLAEQSKISSAIMAYGGVDFMQPDFLDEFSRRRLEILGVSKLLESSLAETDPCIVFADTSINKVQTYCDKVIGDFVRSLAGHYSACDELRPVLELVALKPPGVSRWYATELLQWGKMFFFTDLCPRLE